MIEEINPEYIKISEPYQDKAGDWVEHSIILSKVEGEARRARFRYEQDHALRLLSEIDAAGKKLKERLIQCRQSYGDDAKRLICFDEAVGSLL